MFAPAEMSEVDIFVFENDVQDVAQTVARLGVMHLLDANALGKWAEDVGTEWPGRVSAYGVQERRTRELISQLGIQEEVAACEGRLNPVDDLVTIEEQVQAFEINAQALREKLAMLRRELQRQQLVAKSMEILAPLSVSITDLRQLQHLHLVIGTIPSENLARLEASLFRIPYTIIPLHHYQNRVLVFAFCAEEHAAILERALESAFLDPLSLPEEFGGTAQEVLTQVRQHIQTVEQELIKAETEQAALAEELGPQLLSMLTRIQSNRAIADAMAHFGHRGRVYLIAGWVPKDRVEALSAAVEETAAGRVTIEESAPFVPGERSKVPTLLRNNRLFQPLEKLVATYGVPGYRELDPTPLFAITFVLMFGAMFGDLGHGLSLALVGALLMLKLIRPLAGQASVGPILIACGLSSAVFGVLYGSVFGLEDVIPALWLRPMRDIFTLLAASMVLGVVILNIGFLFNLLTAIREKRLAHAVFSKNGIVGILLYWSLGGVVLSLLQGRPVPVWLGEVIVVFTLALFFAEPLTRLITRTRPLFPGSLGESLVQAFFELFEAIISYVSNTLSYVRLGAFAVAHVGLSSVVLLIADRLGAGLSGMLLRSATILVGSLIVIGFEGLIVGIQTLRLEYYEFFGKFFKGEGVPFKPLVLPDLECQPRPAARRG
jgi:V/A-type H+-transporting ATPase subunit I